MRADPAYAALSELTRFEIPQVISFTGRVGPENTTKFGLKLTPTLLGLPLIRRVFERVSVEISRLGPPRTPAVVTILGSARAYTVAPA